MEDYRDRLKFYLEKRGLKPAFFVKKLDFSNGLMNKVLKKETHLSVDKFEKIFELIPELNIRWLFSGSGEMDLEKVEDSFGVKYQDKAEWYNHRLNLCSQERKKLQEKVQDLETVIKYLEAKR